MSVSFYGLLHLKSGENSAINLAVSEFNEQIVVYIKNAICLSNSLRKVGLTFTLLTNEKKYIDGYCSKHNYTLYVEEIEFNTKVPSGISFYSAHHKIDAYKYLSTLSKDYVGLLDLDMICINKMPNAISNIIYRKLPMYYDISDQVIPAYKHDVIIKDLQSIHNEKSEGRWAGGEFLCGTPSFFKELTIEIEKLYTSYLNHYHNLHHVGDEAIVSAALELMRYNGTYISEVGSLGGVGRYWNANVLHKQKKIESYKDCFLLHLPADKQFLAKNVKNLFDNAILFMDSYLRYMKISLVTRSVKKIKSFIKLIID